jgi:hypothetical protein
MATVNKPLASLFVLLFCLAALGQAQAQGTSVEDPYKKPLIWKKIKNNPNDSSLWVTYVGKKWSAMNRKEQENIAKWRQELYIQSIADKESIIGEVDRDKAEPADPRTKDPFFGVVLPAPASPAARYNESDMKQVATLEQMIMEERPDIAELKKNVFENFVILEDALREAFAELGAQYRYYADVHVDGKYSELKWIEEQETRLKQLKVAKVNQIKKQIKGR